MCAGGYWAEVGVDIACCRANEAFAAAEDDARMAFPRQEARQLCVEGKC